MHLAVIDDRTGPLGNALIDTLAQDDIAFVLDVESPPGVIAAQLAADLGMVGGRDATHVFNPQRGAVVAVVGQVACQPMVRLASLPGTRYSQEQRKYYVCAAEKRCCMVRVGPSSIDRQGLFATQEIKKGTRIIQYMGEKISKAEGARRAAAGNAYIFELNELYDIDGKALTNLARYVNHSCNPNCEIFTTTHTIWVVALRRIQAGEELSYNYGYDIKNYTEYPCRCGAPNCCGFILDQQYWDLLHMQQE